MFIIQRTVQNRVETLVQDEKGRRFFAVLEEQPRNIESVGFHNRQDAERECVCLLSEVVEIRPPRVKTTPPGSY